MKFFCGSDEEYEALFGSGEGKIPLHHYEPRWYTCHKMTEKEFDEFLASRNIVGMYAPLWFSIDTPYYYLPQISLVFSMDDDEVESFDNESFMHLEYTIHNNVDVELNVVDVESDSNIDLELPIERSTDSGEGHWERIEL
jgi:hypothetical protein